MRDFLLKYGGRFLFAVIFCLVSTSDSESSTRQEIHRERLQGLDLSLRSQINTVVPNAVMSTSFGDLQISQSFSPASFTQGKATVIGLVDGGWLVAWEDERLGSTKIYRQRYAADMSPVGSNEILASFSLGADLVEPLLLTDSLGYVYLFYRDRTRGFINAARYNSDLSMNIAPFLVNDSSLLAFAGPFDAAVFPDGRFVVAWEDYSSSGSNIVYQIFNSAGVSSFGPALANSDGGLVQHWVPSVDIQPGSGFLVAWEDYRNGRADIYARLFSGSGTSIAPEFSIVSPPNETASQTSPVVTFSESDKYLLGWIDRRSGQEIYCRRYAADSGLVGTSKLVSVGDTLVLNQTLSIRSTQGMPSLFMWGAFGSDNSVMGVRMDSSLTVVAPPVPFNLSVTGRRWAPSSAFNSAGEFVVVWTEFTSTQSDIYLMKFDSAGLRLLSSELVVNDDSSGAPSTSPSIAAATDWYDLVAWCDRRDDAGDIYLQAVSNAGIKPFASVKVNQDNSPTFQSQPSVSVTGNRSLVVWIDSRPLSGISGQRIYGRFGDELGRFTTSEFIISDSIQASVKESPVAVISPSGQTLVVWIDRRDGTTQVWGRWLDISGSVDGAEMLLSDPLVDLDNSDLSISVDGQQKFIVSWLSKGAVDRAIKVRLFNSDRTDGGGFLYTSTIANTAIEELSVDVDSLGRILALWRGSNNGNRKLYHTQFDQSGNVLLSPFEITDDPGANPSQPHVSTSSDGYSVVVWKDYRSGNSRIFYQVLDNSLNRVGVNMPVSVAIPEFMDSPVVAAHRGRAWFGWVDPRINGLNVFASNTVYLPTDVVSEPEGSLPASFSLEQNYPNPFNPATTINFTLPHASKVRLSVINLLGQTVNLLLDESREAGEHSVVWDGRNSQGNSVASGVYFYRLESDAVVLQKKMMLLK